MAKTKTIDNKEYKLGFVKSDITTITMLDRKDKVIVSKKYKTKDINNR